VEILLLGKIQPNLDETAYLRAIMKGGMLVFFQYASFNASLFALRQYVFS